MGRPMVERLVNRGYIVHVYNRTLSKAEILREELGNERVIVEKTPLDAIVAADKFIVFMMFDFASLCSVLLHDEQAMQALKNKTLLQMMTIGVDESIKAAEIVEGFQAHYVECPVLGTNTVAQDGKLQVLVGLSEEQWQQCNEGERTLEHVLSSFGTVYRIGERPKAMQMKLNFNMVIGSLTSTFANSVAMVERQGNDIDLFMNVLRNSAFYFKYMDFKLPRMLQRNYNDPNFTVNGFLKDITVIRKEAQSLGVYDGVLSSLVDMAQETVDRTGGNDDFISIYEVMNPPEQE